MASLHCYTYHLVDYVSARPGLLRELVELLAQDPSAILLNSFCPLTSDLWFVAVAWERNKDEIVAFLQSQAVRDHLQDESKSVDSPFFPGKCLLSAYLTAHNFTELHLDHIFKLTDTDPELPSGFWTSIPNVRSLSLRSNYLRLLPGDVGRLKHLERLSLTNNRLGNRSLPYTLIFCQKLNELYLDNNLLDAMPGKDRI